MKCAKHFKRDAWFLWRYNIRLERLQRTLAAAGRSVEGPRIRAALLDTASRYEVYKYIAVAHKLMAQIAVAAGDTAGGDLNHGGAERVAQHPVPV